MKRFRAFLNSERVKARVLSRISKRSDYQQIVDEVIDYAATRPRVVQCDQASIVRAIARWATWELTLGSGAFLIPTKPLNPGEREQLIAYQGYRGKIELMKRFRVAKTVDVRLWYSNEHFKEHAGSNPHIEHERIHDLSARGTLVGAYARALLPFGTGEKVEVVHRSKIDQIRIDYSENWGDGDLDDLEWYAKRTAVHQLEVQLPLDARQRRLMLDDADGIEPEDVAPTDLPPASESPASGDSVAGASLPHHSIDPLAVMWEAQVA